MLRRRASRRDVFAVVRIGFRLRLELAGSLYICFTIRSEDGAAGPSLFAVLVKVFVHLKDILQCFIDSIIC